MHSTNLVTLGKIVIVKGKAELTHEYRRDRLPEPIPSCVGYEHAKPRDLVKERGDLDALARKLNEEKGTYCGECYANGRTTPNKFPTFLFTFPDLSDSNKVIRDLERALTKRLGGGFTEWKARGAWNGPDGFTFESVRVYLVSTDKEKELRLIVKGFLDIVGELEGYFVTVGEHTIL